MRQCQQDQGCKLSNGNCREKGSDGLPLQCVGRWASDKYYFLEKYVNATCEVRRMFSDKGNAVFIDLFSGPGKCIIKEKQEETESGGFRVLHRNEAPFNEYYYFDIDKENIDAFRQRAGMRNDVFFEDGDSNILVKKLVPKLLKKKFRYHFAYIDPFAPKNLKFETLSMLAQLNRMDMLIHFPIGAIRRNFDNWCGKEETILDAFLGINTWRNKLSNLNANKVNIYKFVIDVFTEQLKAIGYPEKGLRMKASDGLPAVSVRNTNDVNLYVLILASKHELAQKIWKSIIKIDPSGQRSLF